MARQVLQWFFRNRQTGAITVAQAPNLVLWIVIIAAVARWIWPSVGTFSLACTVVSDGRRYRMGGRRDRSRREPLAAVSRDCCVGLRTHDHSLMNHPAWLPRIRA